MQERRENKPFLVSCLPNRSHFAGNGLRLTDYNRQDRQWDTAIDFGGVPRRLGSPISGLDSDGKFSIVTAERLMAKKLPTNTQLAADPRGISSPNIAKWDRSPSKNVPSSPILSHFSRFDGQ
jgi:hypothetical protein